MHGESVDEIASQKRHDDLLGHEKVAGFRGRFDQALDVLFDALEELQLGGQLEDLRSDRGIVVSRLDVRAFVETTVEGIVGGVRVFESGRTTRFEGSLR